MNGMPVQMDGNNALRSGRDLTHDRLRIHVPRLRLGIDEYRCRPAIRDGIGRGGECQRRNNHFIPGSTPCAMSARWSAVVPLLQVIACFVWQKAANCCSNMPRYEPLEEIHVESRQSVTYFFSFPFRIGACYRIIFLHGSPSDIQDCLPIKIFDDAGRHPIAMQ